jgi:uncharacterized membrane protein
VPSFDNNSKARALKSADQDQPSHNDRTQRRHLEFVVPPFTPGTLVGVIHFVVSDAMKRGVRRALALVPKLGRPISAADCRSVASSVAAAAAGAQSFRLALVASTQDVYEVCVQVAKAADQSPVKAMAFLLQEEAIRWLQMF